MVGATSLPVEHHAQPFKSCSVLTPTKGVSRPDDGADTHAIQEALDLCPPGMAVVLQADGKLNEFRSAPLLLQRGVTLFVDANIKLLASRNLRDYDLPRKGL